MSATSVFSCVSWETEATLTAQTTAVRDLSDSARLHTPSPHGTACVCVCARLCTHTCVCTQEVGGAVINFTISAFNSRDRKTVCKASGNFFYLVETKPNPQVGILLPFSLMLCNERS